MRNFNNRVQTLLEDMAGGANTTATAFGPSQGHPAQVGQSGDFYAPGDARMPPTLYKGKGKKKKKSKVPVIRRTLPASM